MKSLINTGFESLQALCLYGGKGMSMSSLRREFTQSLIANTLLVSPSFSSTQQSKLIARKLRAVHIAAERILRDDQSSAGNEVAIMLQLVQAALHLIPCIIISHVFVLRLHSYEGSYMPMPCKI